MANNISVKITADVVDLQTKRAVMSAELKAATKDLNAFAKEAAAGGATDELRAGMLSSAQAAETARAKIALVNQEIKGFTQTTEKMKVSTGQTQFAMRDLSYQLNDVTSSLASGISPMIVFAQQSSQIVQAISLMRQETTGLIGFLTGPWGAAIMGAATLIGVFVSKHNEAADGTDHQKDAALTLTDAIHKLDEATGQSNRTAEQQARDALAAANALYQQEIQARRTTQAMLEAAMARYTAAEDPLQVTGATSSDIAATIGAAGSDVANLRAKLAEVNKELAGAQNSLRGASGYFVKQRIDDQFDKAAAASHQFERSVASLDDRLKKGEIGVDDYAKAYRKLRDEEEKAAHSTDAKSHRQGGGKSQGTDDLVQRLQAELTAKKLAWDMEQDAQGTAQQFSIQTEKDFWAQALQLTNLSTKDRLAIEEKYLAASKQLRGQKIAGQIEDYKKEEAEAGKNADAKLAIVRKETAFIAAQYGEQSDQYRAALRNQDAAEKDAADQKLAILRTYFVARQKLAEMALAQEDADDKFLVEMHLKTHAQMYAAEKAHLDKMWALQKQDFSRQMQEASKDPQQQAKIQAQELIAYQQYQNRRTQIDRQAILQRTQIERNAINQISQSWGQAFGKLVTFQQGFTASLREMFVGLQQAIGNAIGNIVQQWLEQQITALLLGGAQQQVAAAGQINANAAVAASGAYAATAVIPIVGPELAPAAAATAYAGAIGWMGALAVPGFDVGAWNLSKDQLAMVHTGEMIIPPGMADGMRTMMTMFATNGQMGLPAWAAGSLRDMLSNPSNDNGSTLSRPSAATAGGDVHHHYAINISAADSQDVRRLFMNNKGAFSETVKKVIKEAHFADFRR